MQCIPTHADTHTHTHTCTYTCRYSCTYTYSHMHIHMQIHIHMHMHVHMHMDMRKPHPTHTIHPYTCHSIMYRGGQGAIDINHPWLPAKDNPNVYPVNCSVCKGTCYDRDWARRPGQAGGGPGVKCDMKHAHMNETLAKMIGPCDPGCHVSGGGGSWC